jgi:tetratricopeptide (TPR) repeat protein
MTRSLRLRALAASAVVALSLFGSSAARAGDVAAAEALFREGQAAMQKGDYVAACKAFEASHTADPSVGAQVNLAICNEKQGKLASAWGAYNEAARLALVLVPPEPARGAAAKQKADELAPKLQKIQVRVAVAAEDVQVKQDGKPLAQGVAIPIDPGKHVIEITAKGKKPKKEEVVVIAGQKPLYAIDVTSMDDAPAEAPARPAGADHRPPEGGGSDGSTQRTIGFVVGGAGILALVGAGGLLIFNLAVTESKRKDLSNQLQTDCPNGSPAPGKTVDCKNLKDAYESKKTAAENNQLATQIVAGAGIAMLGTGIVLVLTAPSKKTGTPRLLPDGGPTHAGLSLSGTF